MKKQMTKRVASLLALATCLFMISTAIDADAISSAHRKNDSPLQLLWDEKPGWVKFFCDCDSDSIRQKMLPQLAGAYAVGKDDIERGIEWVVLETLGNEPPTVLVLTHSHDSVCSDDSFRIVTRASDGQWHGDVAHWLGLPRKPGGIKDEELWQLSGADQKEIERFRRKGNDFKPVPRFWWDHATKSLRVGMEACVVIPDVEDTARYVQMAERVETFVARFKPKVYRLEPKTR